MYIHDPPFNSTSVALFQTEVKNKNNGENTTFVAKELLTRRIISIRSR